MVAHREETLNTYKDNAFGLTDAATEKRTQNRFILGFVHIPKTAGTTVKFILRNSTYFRHCDIQPLVRKNLFTDDDFKFLKKIFFFGVRSISGHSLVCPTEHLYSPVQYFTFVREPLQRCLSHYQQLKRSYLRNGGDLSFKEYLQIKGMTDRQVRQIAGRPDLEKAKRELSQHYFFVGLTERFSESMLVLNRLSPYPLKLEYTRRHVTKDNKVRQDVLANPETRRLLKESNQLDLQLYAYVRDELYPTLRGKAGLSAAEDVNENCFMMTSYPLCYKLTRAYNLAVYRSLIKLRRWFAAM